MGSTPPTTQVVKTDPKMYQTVVPLSSYQMAADQVRRAQAETEKLMREGRDVEVGTSAEIGARQRMRGVSEAASYLSSLPKGDKYLREATGSDQPFGDITSKSQQGLSEAQSEYAKALARVDEKRTPTAWETPEWAKTTIEEGMPGANETLKAALVPQKAAPQTRAEILAERRALPTTAYKRG